MKRLFILIIIGLSIALLASYLITLDPGYVRISVGNFLIESNLWMMLALIIALFIIALFAASALRKLLNSRHHITGWLGQSGSKRAHTKTNQGLLAYLEGNWSEANKLLRRSASKSEMPIVNYLAAARAANELGDTKDSELLLKQAYESSEVSDFAVGIAQAQIQLEENQLEKCLATLMRLKKQKPSHPFVLKLLRTVYLKLEDWQQLINLMPLFKKAPNANKKLLNELEEQAWTQLFINKTAEVKPSEKNLHPTDNLAQLWKQLPEAIRFDDRIIEAYARQLIKLDHEEESEALLRKAIARHWSDTLIITYGIVIGKNQSEQLITAENWLKERPNNAWLLLTLGRLALRNELWGKALEYFEASNRLQPSQESYAELCRLSYQMSEDKQKNQRHFQGLIDTLKLPKLPLPK